MSVWTLRHAFNENLWEAVQSRIGKIVHSDVSNTTWKSTIDLFDLEPFEQGRHTTFTMTSLLAQEIGR